MINYENLMKENPFEYGTMTNSIGQLITFVEHPLRGDAYPVICVCHKLKLASCSDFMETSDMEAEHKEYEPSFQKGEFFIGEFKHEL